MLLHRVLLKIFLYTFACVLYVVGTVGVAHAEDEVTYPFSITTTELSENDTFQFRISAAGTFYVDCDGGTLSGTGVTGPDANNTYIITKSDTSDTIYTCTYASGGSKTIQFGGAAMGYNTNSATATIRFKIGNSYPDNNVQKISSISGSLGQIFGTIVNPSTGSGQPSFHWTFYGATNMTGTDIDDPNNPGMKYALPPTLFDGIYGAPAEYMFAWTFADCRGLTGSIPSGLFGNLFGAPAKFMFNFTFYDCSGLTGSIPSGLFGNLSGAAAPRMFESTFDDCSGLTGFGDNTYVPGTFLADIIFNSSALNQVKDMFRNTQLDSTCPAGTYTVTPEQFNDAGKPWCSPCPPDTHSPAGATDISQCVEPEYPFSITGYGHEIFFWLSAAGEFYVDCGNGGSLTSSTISGGNSINGSKIVKSTTGLVEFKCVYSPGSTARVIRFGGQATQYSPGIAAIDFSNSGRCDAASISGDLSAIFPVLGDANDQYPRFQGTFNECKFTSLPENLFASITTGKTSMFTGTFQGCTRLTTIPENLFSNITNGAQAMFNYTFQGCTGLTTIPENLFANITNGAQEMFAGTFQECTKLTTIPENLFANIITGASYMFMHTFHGCTGLTTIPENLFANITSGEQGMFSQTFYGCSNLTLIPGNLFANITTGMNYMFSGAFAYSGLIEIPENLFANITTGAQYMFDGTFQNCTRLTSIPNNLFSNITIGHRGMFSRMFKGCTGLTSLPNSLFTNISSASTGDLMFSETFADCTGLTGYIPPTLFAGIIPPRGNAVYSMYSTFNNTGELSTTTTGCPENYYQFITGYESKWDNHISCTPCPEEATSPAGATSIDQCGFGHTLTYNCDNGDSTTNTSIEYAENSVVTVSQSDNHNCTKTGFAFNGWICDPALDSNDQITITQDMTCIAQWTQIEFPFTLTTTELPNDDMTFTFTLSPSGTFYVNCGDGGVLTMSNSIYPVDGGTNVSGPYSNNIYIIDIIRRTSKDNFTYTCTYSTNTPKTIRFSGLANNAINRPYAPNQEFISTINFEQSCSRVASIDGDLSGIFPFYDSSSSSHPQFINTFRGCSNLTEIPNGLFGYNNITGDYYMFDSTFENCTGLTYLPQTLFGGIRGALSGAQGMFRETFYGCTNLTGFIPPYFFGSGMNASNLMRNIFYGDNEMDTQCPAGYYKYITGYEQYWDDRVSCKPCPDEQTSPVGATSIDQCGFGHTLTYNCDNGDSTTNTSVEYAENSVVTVSQSDNHSCTKTGFIFNGWTCDPVLDSNDQITITQDTTCTAQWQNKHTLTYNCNNGDSTTNTSIEYAENSVVTVSQSDNHNCTKTGFAFNGWICDPTLDSNDQITITQDTTCTAQWAEITYPFTLTTTELSANDIFEFTMSASGVFYIDCGTDGTLKKSAAATKANSMWNVISDNTIVHTDTYQKVYACSYTTGGVKTIKFGGTPIAYNAVAQTHSVPMYLTSTASPLGFADNTKISSVSGNLSELFPVLDSSVGIWNRYPRFYKMFENCTNLTSVSGNLFSGYTNAQHWMFLDTFKGCTRLTSIPSDLFENITSATAAYAFASTFEGCTGLTYLPENLFSNINLIGGRADAAHIFDSTFKDCTGLTSIPGNLFAFNGNIYSGSSMFSYTFSGCTGLKYLPENLFASFTSVYWEMFTGTFAGCTGLNGNDDSNQNFIPPSLFAGLIANGSPTATDVMSGIFFNTTLRTKCPADYYKFTTGYESYWNRHVSCKPCPDGKHSLEGATSIDKCVDGIPEPEEPVEHEYPFSITTTEMEAESLFVFNLTPYGEFYVDCGEDGVLMDVNGEIYDNTIIRSADDFGNTSGGDDSGGSSGDDAGGDFDGKVLKKSTQTNNTRLGSVGKIRGQNFVIPKSKSKFSMFDNSLNRSGKTNRTVSRSGSTRGKLLDDPCIEWDKGGNCIIFDGPAPVILDSMYACFYETAGTHTIHFGGAATGYANLEFSGASIPVISFNSAEYVQSVSGNLSALFPSVGSMDIGGVYYDYPYAMFENTFSGCTNLTLIPSTLFADITSGSPEMFSGTFGQSGITSIPGDLFANIETDAYDIGMFDSTFWGCSNLTQIPSNLFANVTIGSMDMFAYTFDSSGITSIPDDLFENVTTGAPQMFEGTFVGCENLTSIPDSLFANITTFDIPPEEFRAYWDEYSTGAEYMFSYTFQDCANLSGYVPSTLFAGLTPRQASYPANMMESIFDNTNIATSCETYDMEQYITGYEDDYGWEDKVSCKEPEPPFDDYRFFITTTEMPTDEPVAFEFNLKASGTFYVDCNGGTLVSSNGSDVSGSANNGWVIKRSSNSYFNAYACVYNYDVEENDDPVIDDPVDPCIGRGCNPVVTKMSSIRQKKRSGSIKFNNRSGSIKQNNRNSSPTGSANSTTHTIRFGGQATEYRDYMEPAISFQNNEYVKTVSGNLSAIFPVLDSGENRYPSFIQSFFNCENLTSISSDLFADITTGTAEMFGLTFAACPNLTQIPDWLFSHITTGAPGMFLGTFMSTGITQIPQNLFSSITSFTTSTTSSETLEGLASILNLSPENMTGAEMAFADTFAGCRRLTTIPQNLFANITNGAAYMFAGTFAEAVDLSEVMDDSGNLTEDYQQRLSDAFGWNMEEDMVLFAELVLFPSEAAMMASSLQQLVSEPQRLTQIPSNLFANIQTTAPGMFYGTFFSRSALTGYVSPNLFKKITPRQDSYPEDMMAGVFFDTGIATSCEPYGMQQYITGYEGNTYGWGDKVSCKHNAPEEFVCESGKYLHIGEDKMCLAMEENVKKPALAIGGEGRTTSYLRMTKRTIYDESLPINEKSTKKLNIFYNGDLYNVHDASVGE